MVQTHSLHVIKPKSKRDGKRKKLKTIPGW
jgi:hypothetical protein